MKTIEYDVIQHKLYDAIFGIDNGLNVHQDQKRFDASKKCLEILKEAIRQALEQKAEILHNKLSESVSTDKYQYRCGLYDSIQILESPINQIN